MAFHVLHLTPWWMVLLVQYKGRIANSAVTNGMQWRSEKWYEDLNVALRAAVNDPWPYPQEADCFLNILGKWPTCCTNFFYVFISIYNSLQVSSTQCSSSGETNCINTASGNSHSMLVAKMCAGWKNLLLLPTCTHLGHQHRMTVTRGCIDTICLSWWWALCAGNM